MMEQADDCVNRIIDKFDSSKLSLRKLYIHLVMNTWFHVSHLWCGDYYRHNWLRLRVQKNDGH